MPDDTGNHMTSKSCERSAAAADPPESAEALLERLRPKQKPTPATDSGTKAKRSRREAEPFCITDRELSGRPQVSRRAGAAVWAFILRERRVRQAIGQPLTFALTNASLASGGSVRHQGQGGPKADRRRPDHGRKGRPQKPEGDGMRAALTIAPTRHAVASTPRPSRRRTPGLVLIPSSKS